MSDNLPIYDVVIVGAGIAGAILAKELGNRGHSVLIIESGAAIPHGRESLMEKFFLDPKKLPESPYPKNHFAPAPTIEDLDEGGRDPTKSYLDQSDAKIPFGSTYERRAGGTMWHWMGTSLRFVPSDFRLKSRYGRGVDWPITYKELAIESRRPDGASYYDLAEDEIGVAASKADQKPYAKNEEKFPEAVVREDLFRRDREYPMPAIPISTVDQFFQDGLGGFEFDEWKVWHYPTPAGRNSRPYKNRRACAGNTNCVPICPIQAKYDPTVTLHAAFNNQHVVALFQCVVTRLIVDPSDRTRVDAVEYVCYEGNGERSPGPPQRVRGRVIVVAANGIETPRLLLMSRAGGGAFGNENIGKNLMDHPFYLRYGLAQREVYPYRGPLSTGGLDGLRDGTFREKRSAFRIEIGNDGWRLKGDPDATLLDMVDNKRLYGVDLVKQLNYMLTRQVRIGFELEQLPDPTNAVTLSTYTDPLGLRRPKITYSVSEYEAAGFAAAARFTSGLFAHLKIDDKTPPSQRPTVVDWEGGKYEFFGAGHIMGTCRMGNDPKTSVVNRDQRCHDYWNTYIVGSAVFPTSGTANPSLTLAALAFWAADSIADGLESGKYNVN